MSDVKPTDFIREMIRADLESGKYSSVVTRFPPEPNGYLHIGHAKSICLNFGVAEEFGGRCHLRFDDTNPSTEDPEYVESIQQDVRWLGFNWDDNLYFASDYFQRMYELAQDLIRAGKAYVDSSNGEEIRLRRGTVTEDGVESPFRTRPVEESLDLLKRMKAGEFDDGSHVVRAKIDMTANNMLMRDPLLFRIRRIEHYRQGTNWCVYPMYDYAHCLEDAIEGVTHSLCTLEFENNREVYDWVLENTGFTAPRPEQTEFARLKLGYTMLSKRRLLRLVEDGHVEGWNDPRMPTLSGLRRRGYTPEAIRTFCERIGITRTYNVIDVALLEHALRDDLNHRAPRVMAVLDPLRVVIENYDEDREESLEASYWPHDVPKEGSRQVPFGRELLIERSDFEENPPKGFRRLAPGREVRLRYGYVIRCQRVVKNDSGEIVELRCTYDPETQGGQTGDGRKIASTIHWLSEVHALKAEVRLYDRLFTTENPDGEENFEDHLNERSLVTLSTAFVEPSLASIEPASHVQFERHGYFFTDPEDSSADSLVFNRTVTLRDTWAKVVAEGDTEAARLAKEKAAARKAHKEAQRRHAADDKPAALDAAGQAVSDAFVARGVSEQQARLFALDADLAAFFDAAAKVHDAASVAPWLTTEVLGRLGDRTLRELPFTGTELGELAQLVDKGTITPTIGKKVLDRMVIDGGRPQAIVDQEGLGAIDDAAEIEKAVDQVLEKNASQVEAYRAGKTALLGFFIGQVMAATRGRADAQQVRGLLQQKLS